ncbi:AI-2E family transporter [Chelativorans alearense]|uniref:AI-2E family transporter n=1 Tax=Chelativorans alearense TaxID=2681495 RepID=UPI0013D1943C|nr:AI-2E family transporter [Chelativorans alearense]
MSHNHQTGQKEQRERWYHLACWFSVLVALILVVTALRATSWLSSTIAFSFFTALAVWPVDAFVRDRMPRSLRWLGHVAALLLMLLVFGLFLVGLAVAARQITAGLPKYEPVFQVWQDRLYAWVESAGLTGGQNDAVSGGLINSVVGYASTVIQSIWSAAGIISLIFFLVLLLLLEAPSLEAKLRATTARNEDKLYHSALSTIAVRIRWYLAVRTALGLATALLYALWSWGWQLDFILVWAVLAFLLNYIPTVGSIVAGILPAAFAFLQLSPLSAALYGVGLLIIEQIMGNYIDPKLQGEQLALSPLAILIALMFWSWVWGILGALVAVPTMLAIVVVCARIPALQPVALFLSDSKNIEQLKTVTRV